MTAGSIAFPGVRGAIILSWIETMKAYVVVDTWCGRMECPIDVFGETPKRYRAKFLKEFYLPGGRHLHPGDVALVPKTAVRFEKKETNGGQE